MKFLKTLQKSALPIQILILNAFYLSFQPLPGQVRQELRDCRGARVPLRRVRAQPARDPGLQPRGQELDRGSDPVRRPHQGGVRQHQAQRVGDFVT